MKMQEFVGIRIDQVAKGFLIIDEEENILKDPKIAYNQI